MIESLAAGVPIDRLARYFEYWLLRLQGVYPPLSGCGRCGGELIAGAWLVGGGTLACARCGPSGDGGRLSAAAISFLGAARVVSPAALADVELPPPAGRELARAHHRLIATHLEKELKSLRVVRSLTRDCAGD